MSAQQRGRAPLDKARVWKLHQEGLPGTLIAHRMGWASTVISRITREEAARLTSLKSTDTK